MADNPDEWRVERGGNHARGTSDSWLDDRGVSEVIGSILVFGLLVSLLAIVQMQAVPDANKEVEVKHSGDVQGDMANLQAAITRSAVFGGSESTVVETGMTYPPRLVLYNPPAVQGTLRTTEERSADLVGFQALDQDTNDRFVDQSGSSNTFRTLSFPTHSIVYRPDYNRYDNAPTTTYEYTALVNRFDDGRATVQSSGTLVDGNRISLVLVDGGLQETSVRPASVTVYPVSAPAQTVEVETVPGVQGRLALPTRMSEETWVSEILDGQIDENAIPSGTDPTTCADIGVAAGNAKPDDGKYIVNCAPQGFGNDDPSDNQLVLFFEADKSYRLRTAKVGFSAGVEAPPAYLTRVDSGTLGTLEVEVRDAFGNPVDQREAIVVEELDPSGSVTASTTRSTNTNGRIRYDPTRADGSVRFYDASAYSPESGTVCNVAPECVEFDLGTTGSKLASANVQLTEVTTGGSSSSRLNIGLENTGHEDVEITHVRLGGIKQQEPSGLTLSGTLGVSLAGTTTEYVDGPDSITGVGTGGSTSSLASDAVENRERKALASPVTLSSGSTTTLSMDFNEQLNVGGSAESVTVTVTVYYSDGTRSTFTQYVYDSSGA